MRRSGIKVVWKFIGLVKPLLHVMTAAILMGVLGYLCAILIPVFGGIALAGESKGAPLFSLSFLFISIILFAVLRGILRYGEQLCNHYIAFKLLALIRKKVFDALSRLAPAKLEGKSKGNLITVITSDIELMEVFYAHTISPVIIAIITSVVMALFIGSFYPVLGILAFIGYLTVGAAIPLLTSRKAREDGYVLQNKLGDMNGFLLDSLRGLGESLQYSDTENRLKKINKKTKELGSIQSKLKKTEGNNKGVTNIAVLFFSAVMLFCSLFLLKQGKMEFEGAVISTVAMMSSFGPVIALSSLANNLSHTFAGGNRILDILEEEPLVEEVKDKQEVIFQNAVYENVSFSYDKESVLKDVFLKIPKNKIVGIHGKSGSGKSTLLKLLMRFWDVQNGRIMLSEKDIKEINTTNLRDMESYMTQETYLFHDSIFNNIRIGKQNATLEEVKEAAKKASIHTFIESLPKGYDTAVGELGEGLSGGEKQRIGLARAFLHDAPLLLLDEPTSNLDSLNEAVILQALLKECKEKTVVLVSHRKSTMGITDIVYEVRTRSEE